MGVLNEFEELKQMMHLEEAQTSAPTTPELVSDSIALYRGQLCVIISVRKDGDVIVISEGGSTVRGRMGEFIPISDDELYAILEQRKQAAPPSEPEVEIKPRITPPPPGGNIPAPPAEHQVYCRVWNRRWSRNGFPQATVSLLGGFVQFNCTVFNGKTMLPGSQKSGWTQVFWGRENKTQDLCLNIAKRILNGSLETNTVEIVPEGLTIKITGQKNVGRNGKVGSGRLAVIWKGMTISIPYTVFDNGDGYNITIPSFNGRDSMGFYALNQWINADIKGAILVAWANLTGNEPKPARKTGKRACRNCRYHFQVAQGSRSTWDITDNGEMAPAHLCLHPERMKEAKGAWVWIDDYVCRLMNQSLSQYGRDVKESAIIWVTPHKRGIPAVRRLWEIQDSCCPLHTYQWEVDTSRIRIAEGKREGVIEITSRPSRQDDAAPQETVRIPFTW